MFQIKSSDQRQKTLKRIGAIEAQIQHVRSARGDAVAEVLAKASQRHLSDLRAQIKAYDELMAHGVAPMHPQRLSEVGPYLVKARIAAGLTQAELAKALGVSQPMVHKYERGEYQGASAEILTKVAKAVGVSVNLEAFCRAGTRAYDPKRQEAAIQYLAEQCANVYLGRTKLMKLLYYTDYEWLQQHGVSITGDSYVAMPYGPIPKHGNETLERLRHANAIRIDKTKLGNYDQDRCVGVEKADLSCFTAEEVAHLNSIARRFEHWTAKQMSDLTHEDWPWQSTSLGEEIPLFLV